MIEQNLLDAECAVLGSILIDARCTHEATEILTPDDFCFPMHKDIYSAVCRMFVNSEAIDPITILRTMQEQGAYNVDAARSYMLQLMEITPTAANIAEYVKIVKNESGLRALRSIGCGIQEQTKDGEDYREITFGAIRQLETIQQSGKSADLVDTQNAILHFMEYRTAFEQNPGKAFVKSGIRNLDALLGGGFVNSGFYVIAARPGMGKTSVALNIADSIAESGKKVLFITLEMSENQITSKRIARVAGLSSNAVLMHKLSEEDYKKVVAANAQLVKLPVTINRKESATMSDIMSFAAKEHPDVIFIDYIGLIRPSERRQKRNEEVGEVSRGIKALALRLNVPIVCLAQLNRENESQKDKHPHLYHLRDSGDIEQDADCVAFIFREGYYADQQDKKQWESDEMEFYTEKNRHYNTGKTKFAWYGATGRIVPM